MAFKNPIKIDKLETITKAAHLKVLDKILVKGMLKDGEQAPFIIITNLLYKGSSADISMKNPMFLLGASKDGKNKLDEFLNRKIEGGEKQKSFTFIGMCTRQGNYLQLTLSKSKGGSKIPAKTMDYLKIMIKGVSSELTIGTKKSAKTGGVVAGGVSKEEKKPDSKISNTEKETRSEKKEKPEITTEKKEKLVQKYKEDKFRKNSINLIKNC